MAEAPPTIVALALGSALMWWLSRTWGPPANPSTRYKLTRLTSDSGLTYQPSVSPDGKFVAYASDRSGDGNLDIWNQPIGFGEPIRLTSHEANDHRPFYSGDGSQIVFRSERDGGGIYVVPALGGNARLLAKGGYSPSFSSDGRWVAYSAFSPRSHDLYVIPAAGGQPKKLELDLPQSFVPVWVPSGSHLLFLAQGDLWATSLTGGGAMSTGFREVLDQAGLDHLVTVEAISYAFAADTSHIVFAARFGDAVNLWQVPISQTTWRITGEPERLTSGVSEAWPSVSKDGRLVYSELEIDFDIWGVKISANRGAERAGSQSTPPHAPQTALDHRLLEAVFSLF